MWAKILKQASEENNSAIRKLVEIRRSERTQYSEFRKAKWAARYQFQLKGVATVFRKQGVNTTSASCAAILKLTVSFFIYVHETQIVNDQSFSELNCFCLSFALNILSQETNNSLSNLNLSGWDGVMVDTEAEGSRIAFFEEKGQPHAVRYCQNILRRNLVAMMITMSLSLSLYDNASDSDVGKDTIQSRHDFNMKHRKEDRKTERILPGWSKKMLLPHQRCHLEQLAILILPPHSIPGKCLYEHKHLAVNMADDWGNVYTKALALLSVSESRCCRTRLKLSRRQLMNKAKIYMQWTST